MNNPSLNHLAIIMDGNARWAKSKGLPQLAGHKKGVEILKNILEATIKLEIPHLTLYSFSTENWKRGTEEVNYLLGLLSTYLKKEIHNLNKNEVNVFSNFRFFFGDFPLKKRNM